MDAELRLDQRRQLVHHCAIIPLPSQHDLLLCFQVAQSEDREGERGVAVVFEIRGTVVLVGLSTVVLGVFDVPWVGMGC
jgi:hypothetical protein